MSFWQWVLVVIAFWVLISFLKYIYRSFRRRMDDRELLEKPWKSRTSCIYEPTGIFYKVTRLEYDYDDYSFSGEREKKTVEYLEEVIGLTGKWYIKERDGKPSVMYMEIGQKEKSWYEREVRESFEYEWKLEVGQESVYFAETKWLAEFDIIEMHKCDK